MYLLSSLLLALAVSLDGLFVGMACGWRRLRISRLSLVMVGLVSAGMVAGASRLGYGLLGLISPRLGDFFGSLVLVFLGWRMLPGRTRKRQLVDLLEHPEDVDTDLSGSIGVGEALVLGFALGLDALSMSFGAALSGSGPYLLPLLVGVIGPLFLSVGLLAGRQLKLHPSAPVPYLAGSVLVLVGLWRMLF